MIIYCTSKLKEFFKPIISKVDPLAEDDKWNAHLFYIKGRKCVAFIHKETLYVVIIFDILKKDLVNIQGLFKDAFTHQLYSDRILDKQTENSIRDQIGDIHFCPTDNDKRTIGSLNDSIYRITFWTTLLPDPMERIKQYVYKDINQAAMASLKYKFPKELMRERIKNKYGIFRNIIWN